MQNLWALWASFTASFQYGVVGGVNLLTGSAAEARLMELIMCLDRVSIFQNLCSLWAFFTTAFQYGLVSGLNLLTGSAAQLMERIMCLN